MFYCFTSFCLFDQRALTRQRANPAVVAPMASILDRAMLELGKARASLSRDKSNPADGELARVAIRSPWTSLPDAPPEPPVEVPVEVPPPKIRPNTPACYLRFTEASGGAFLTHWSRKPVVGALAAFFPSKAVPGFKFTTNGGVNEQSRGLGGPNKKPFYAGWASFVRTANSHSGTFVFYGNVASTPVAIYLCQTDTTVLKVPLNVPVELTHTLAVAVLPMLAIGLNVHNMPPRMFTNVGQKEGAATSLDGGGDGMADTVRALSPRRSLEAPSPPSARAPPTSASSAVAPIRAADSIQHRIDANMRV